ncbi:MAG: site-specific DNA-methyltransferase [Gammaproteobacteria bacterium]|nr:site-specific DNA-methyltransferase [Gammaproteobacteria bacterium]
MKNITISKEYNKSDNAVVYHGSCLTLLKEIPDNSIELIVTSPPYNIGKEYEKRANIETYLEQQKNIITECHRVLSNSGNICWQVGNFVNKGEIIPLDTLLYPIFNNLGFKMRNRIVWHFEHGLHCSKRFSGRYETINWFTKSDKYTFNLEPVRVLQKYPGKKYFKGPKAGQYSCNPLGKNPGDLWQIPNVKNNHPEKTEHPCQFPVELVERLVLSMTNENETVFDPFLGAGTSVIAALKNNRKGIGSEIEKKYINLINKRLEDFQNGKLKTRPMNKKIYDPSKSNISYLNFQNKNQLKFFEKPAKL